MTIRRALFGQIVLGVALGACAQREGEADPSPISQTGGATAGGRGAALGGRNNAAGNPASGGSDSGGRPDKPPASGGAWSSASGGGNAVASGGRTTNTTGGTTSVGGGVSALGGAPAMQGGAASALGGAAAGGRTSSAGGAASGGAGASDPARVVGYFAQWGIYQRAYRVKNIAESGAAAGLTVINYAFGNVVNGACVMVSRAGVGDAFADYQKSFAAEESVDGAADTWDQKLKGNFNQLKKLKARYPNIKVLISIGGWTWSKGFSDAALTAESRAAVVKSCIDLYIRGDLPMLDGDPAGGPGAAAGVFDGIDIDWEYPAMAGDVGSVYRDEDTKNFTLLLAEFRRQLTAIDPKLLLTIAAPAGKPQSDKIELGAIHQHLDWINLMTYDMHGAWDAKGPTDFHSPLYTSPDEPTSAGAAELSSDATVTRYLNAGVPSSKLTLGIPFYGRGWSGVAGSSHGLYQTTTGPAPGTYEAGIEDYKVLVARKAPGFRDSKAGAYWTFDGNEFWSFDDPENIRLKTEYIRSKRLGGVMVWSLDGDTKDGELMRAVASGMARP
ncbi:MAG TPA: glycoside hydrolase family 18 protein [Polyangiaceae bacterium]|nr:glycoside hydrolase family 18 protein [Polyangiaceae bacterium]